MKTLRKIKDLIFNLTRDGSELNKRLINSIELTEKNLIENKKRFKKISKKHKLFKSLKKERKTYKKAIKKLYQKLVILDLKKENKEGLTELSRNIDILINLRIENL